MTAERMVRNDGRALGVNLVRAAAACMLAAAPALLAPALLAQDVGVSVPQPVTTVDTAVPTTGQEKPSAAIPATPATGADASAPVVYGPYVPYRGPGALGDAALPVPAAERPFDPDATIVTEDTLHRRAPAPDNGAFAGDPDAGIVLRAPTRPGEIIDGTLIKARLREALSTVRTRPGTKFTAEVSEPVMQDGRVYIPAGSVLEGRVTWLRSGKRIGGSAAIHLEPTHITLPDGVEYPVHARAVDTSSWQNTKVDDEGTILRRDNLKGTLEAGGLAAGGAMAAGAVIGGVPGALIGAGIGAGATAVVWFKQDRQAELPKDLGVVFSLTMPLPVTPVHASLPPTASTASPAERLGGE